MSFGDKIKELRHNLGISQAELGKMIGVSDRVVGYYESNERFPGKQDILIKIASVFNVSADYLFNIDNSSEQNQNNEFSIIESNQAQCLLQNVKMLFMMRELKEEAKDEIFEIITNIYFDSKKRKSQN